MKAGLAAGATHFEHVYRTPDEVHNPMEPHATIAVWPDPEHLVLYDATQGVFTARGRVASFFGIPEENVRGYFALSWRRVWQQGSGVVTRRDWRACGKAGAAAGEDRVLSASDVRNGGTPLGNTADDCRRCVKSDGTITALSHDTVSLTSSFDEFVETASLVSRMLYAAPNSSTSHKVIKSDLGMPNDTRAPGEVGRHLRARMRDGRACLRTEDGPGRVPLEELCRNRPEKKLPWSSKSLRECYRLGAKSSDGASVSAAPCSCVKPVMC